MCKDLFPKIKSCKQIYNKNKNTSKSKNLKKLLLQCAFERKWFLWKWENFIISRFINLSYFHFANRWTEQQQFPHMKEICIIIVR